MKTYFGKIRKIIVGRDPKDALTYEVGKVFSLPKAETLTVTEIVRDENSFYYFGSVTYIVYAKLSGKGEAIMWKYFENHCVIVECEI